MKNIANHLSKIPIVSCFTFIILFASNVVRAQPTTDPCDPNRTNTPTVTHDFCGSETISTISGYSSANEGASIEVFHHLSVYDHPLSLGTTTVDSNGAWQLNGLNINAGFVSATAQAEGELTSQPSTEIEIKLPPRILVSQIAHPTICGAFEGGFELSGFSPMGLANIYFNNEGESDSVSVSANAFGQVSISQLPAGDYSDIYAVVDGCVTNTICNVSLTAPAEVPLAYGVSIPPSQCGGNGTIKLIGGFIPFQSYQVTYFDGTSTVAPTELNADILGVINVTVAPGTYSKFQVSDGSCATGTLNESITISDGLLPDVINVGTILQPTSCTASDGSVELTGLQLLVPIDIYYEDEEGNQQSVIAQSSILGTYTLSDLQEGELRDLRVVNPNTGCSSNPLETIQLFSLSEISLLNSASPTSCLEVDGSIRIGGAGPLQSYGVNFHLDGNNYPTIPVTADENGEIELTELAPGDYTNIYITQGDCQSNILSDIVILEEIEIPEISVGSFSPPNLCTGEDGEIKLLGLPAENKVYDVLYESSLGPVAQNMESENGVITILGLEAGEYTDFSVSIGGCSSNTVSCSINLSETSNSLPQISLQSTFSPTECELDDGHIRLISVLQNEYLIVYYTVDEVQYTEQVLSDSVGVISINNLVAGDYTDIYVEYNGCESNKIPRVSLTDIGLEGAYISSVTTPTVCGYEDATLEISGLITGISYEVEAELEGALGMQIGLGQFSPSDVGKLVVTNLSAGLYKNIRVSTNNCLSANLGSIEIECFSPTAYAVATKTIDKLANNFEVAVPSDPDGDILCAEVIAGSLPQGLMLDGSSGVVYVSNQLDLTIGTFEVTIQSTDEKGHTSETEISIEMLNDTPAPIADYYTLDEGDILSVAAAGVLLNDVDYANDGLTVTLVSSPTHASSFNLISDGSFEYEHDGSETVSDSLVYEVSDGWGESAQAKVYFTIHPVNDPPILGEVFFPGDEDIAIQFNSGEFEANFQDAEGDTLTAIRFESLPLSNEGEITLNGTAISANQEIDHSDIHNLLFTPYPGFYGTINFNWNGSDGSEYAISSASAVIELERFNNLPTAQDTTITILEDEVYVFSPEDFGYHDLDGDPFTQVYINSIPENGFLRIVTTFGDNILTGSASVNYNDIASGIFEYVPLENEHGQAYDFFNFSVYDGTDPQSGSNEITFHVLPVNDAPIAVDDEYEFIQNVAIQISASEGVLANDLDVDGDSLYATLQDSTENGTLVFNSDGSFTYTPTTGSDSFSYSISDGNFISQLAWVYLDEDTNRRMDGKERESDNNEQIDKESSDPLVSTLITPDGNGKNDVWIIIGIENHPNNVARIFDQSGRMVREIMGYDNISNVWDGSDATKSEVYYYILDLGNNEIIRGKILVHR